MALLKEASNQFGNGTSNYWSKSKVVFDENLGLKVMIVNYFSEQAKKENRGSYINLIELDYSADEVRAVDPGLLQGGLINDLFDLPFHLGYILVKRDIASASEKVDRGAGDDEFTANENKLKILIGYEDNI